MHDNYQLLDKTELKIKPIGLRAANLDQVARVVAQMFELSDDEVYVIDAIGDVLSLDILRTDLDAGQLLGKEAELLDNLARLPGIEIHAESRVEAEGILGWITMAEEQGQEMLTASREMADEIHRRLAKRARVFSTGAEVLRGEIEDTNKPYLLKTLAAAGFNASAAAPLDDDHNLICAALSEAGNELGYGLLITTGGVGAEKKDCTIEALEALDPKAHTPYILKFTQGQGRHAKPGVRVAVGQIGTAMVVCLPGPNEEVRLAIKALLKGIEQNQSRAEMAEAIAEVLRDRFIQLKAKKLKTKEEA